MGRKVNTNDETVMRLAKKPEPVKRNNNGLPPGMVRTSVALDRTYLKKLKAFALENDISLTEVIIRGTQLLMNGSK